MTVKQLINELHKYDQEKEVFMMREHKDDDITYADSIDEVKQRTLTIDDFEYIDVVAVVLLHIY